MNEAQQQRHQVILSLYQHVLKKSGAKKQNIQPARAAHLLYE